MKGKELIEELKGYEDFDIEFSFTDGCNPFPNIRRFINMDIGDIGHSDKVVILDGDERE